MIQATRIPSCERFAQIAEQAAQRELTSGEVLEYFDHIECCTLHSDSALEHNLGLPRGAFSSGSVEHSLPSAKERAERILRQLRWSPIQLAFTAAADLAQAVSETEGDLPRTQLDRLRPPLLPESTATGLLERLSAAGVRRAGHMKFLRGCRVGTYSEFGRLRGSNVWDLVLEQCRLALLPTLSGCRPDFIVGHTATMYEIARDLAASIGTSRTHVLLALGDDRPFVVVPHNEVRGKTIAVLLDAVMSGALLEKLCRTIQHTLQARVVFIGCLIDHGYSGALSGRLHTLCRDVPDKYLDPCPRCSSGEPAQLYDHSAGMAVSCRPEHEVNSEWKASFSDYAEWWQWIEQTGALSRNKSLGGYVYEYFIDTKRLLEVAPVRTQLLARVAERLAKLASEGDWVIAFRDLPRNPRPRLVAQCVASLCGWPLVCVTLQKGKLFVSSRESTTLHSRRVLIVDPAVNSGDTIKGLAQLLRDRGANHVAAFTLISRLHDETTRRQINGVLDRPLDSLFPFPFRAVRTSVAVHSRLRESLKSLQDEPVLGEYYQLVQQRGHFARSVSPQVSSRRLAALHSLWISASSGKLADVFADAGDQRALHALLKALPKDWGQYPHVKQALCAIARNGVAIPTLEQVATDLTAIGCFDWLPNGWLTDHIHVLRAKSWGFVPLCMKEAVAADPSMRPTLRNEILSLLNARSGTARQENLPFDSSQDRRTESDTDTIRNHLTYLLGVVKAT